MSRLEKLIERLLREPPDVRVEDIRRVLEWLGYKEHRGGKHVHVFRHLNGDKQTIPTVGGRKVKRTYVSKKVKLLEEAGYGRNE